MQSFVLCYSVVVIMVSQILPLRSFLVTYFIMPPWIQYQEAYKTRYLSRLPDWH